MYSRTQFIARARQMVGLPYVLGAEWSPKTIPPGRPTALDCSELVEGLFRENGTPIADLAASQYDATVPVADVQTGDLVFLRNAGPSRWNGIGHVALITAPLANGDWEVIEAKGRAYGVVRTTLSYWRTRTHFAGVRRFPGLRFAPEPTKGERPQHLAAVGVKLTEDGSFGPRTKAALQKLIGVKQTRIGIWDDTDRRNLQRWLGVTVDGHVGPITVRALQKRVGARVDGSWGPATTRALQAYINRGGK